MKNKIYISLLFFFVTCISSFFLVKNAISPAMKWDTNKIIMIHPKSSVKEISNILYSNNIIKSSFIFKIIAKISGQEHKLKAGEYEFQPSNDMIDVFKKIARGEFKKYAITIPEGFTIKDIADMLESKGIVDKNKFLSLISDAQILKKYKIDADSLEGYLFPDTYSFYKGISEEKLIDIMLEHFFSVFDENFEARARQMNFTRHEVVILASIIEKEAKAENERNIIAAVFLNRIKKKMRLESCATVLYALGKHKSRLWEEDLKIDSPYNTYLYTGLPKGPISNPGKASIYAVLYPEKADYLFFVSRNDGTHEFAHTFQEHVRLKNKYIH
ncbi:endolytic transglycosylase MltG [Candidatus Poribacteria bacterium]|nr:endolytic transglycosylase MltG [Candidatus Poribacteria bacterium]